MPGNQPLPPRERPCNHNLGKRQGNILKRSGRCRKRRKLSRLSMPPPGRRHTVISSLPRTSRDSHPRNGRRSSAGISGRAKKNPTSSIQGRKPRASPSSGRPGSWTIRKKWGKFVRSIFCQKPGVRGLLKRGWISVLPILWRKGMRGLSSGSWKKTAVPVVFMKKAGSLLMEPAGNSDWKGLMQKCGIFKR